MRKLKITLLVLAIGAILAGGAFLPVAVAAVMDHVTAETIHTAPISDLTLEFQEQKPEEDALFDKLALLYPAADVQSFSVSDAQTNFTTAEILEHLDQALEDYYQAGLIRRMTGEIYRNATPWLNVDRTTGRFFVSWDIMLDSPQETGASTVYATLDDETGDILSIHYSCPWSYTTREMEQGLEALTSIYTSRNGLDRFSPLDTVDKRSGQSMMGFSADSCAQIRKYSGSFGEPFQITSVVYPYGFDVSPMLIRK